MSFFDSHMGRTKGPLGVNNMDGSRYSVWGNPGPQGFNSTMRATVDGPGRPTVFNAEALACPAFVAAVSAWRQAEGK